MRWILGLPIAAVITLLIFFAMSAMIRQPVRVDTTERPEISPITAQRVEPTTPPPPGELTDPVDPPPPVDTFPEDFRDDDRPIVIDSGPLPPDPTDPIGGPKIDFPKPAITFPPQYPERCRAKNAEGAVVVEFDVTSNGDVINPRIISSADSCFNREALKTIQRWKYTPDVVDGKPAPQRNVRYVFRFELGE